MSTGAAPGLHLDDRDPFGLVSPFIFSDPHPIYHFLRYAEPVHWSEVLNAWVLTSYEDVSAALKDRRLSNALRREAGTARLSPELRERMAPIDRYLSLWVLNLDDEEHQRLRLLLIRGFTPRALEAIRPRIAELAGELLDALPSGETVDFVERYARPLPVRVIAEMFGVPEEARPLLSEWSGHISRFFEYGPARVDVLDNMLGSVEAMTAYLRDVVEENRGNPRQNVLGYLVQAQESGERLSEEQLLATCLMLLFAGHDSTVNLIGSSMLSLLLHPDQLFRLRHEPTLMRNAVHEFLRFESPVMRHDRLARETFDLHGHTIRAGDRVVVVLGAANRDPAMFPDPDRVDVARPNAGKHLTFGAGPHSCLGGSLAVAQAQIALNLVLERFSELRLSREPFAWREHFNFRGLRTLPVELVPPDG